ncbi:MAG: zf-HC2 domain-containing protein [Dehalococcoidia bacterium]
MFWRRHPVSDEQLSAYLDEQLVAAAGARVQAHVESCASCRQTLDELRAMRSALRSLPSVAAPRSYTLREADVQTPAYVQPGWPSRTMPALSGLTAAALVAFVVLVGVDISDQGSGGAREGSPATTAYDAAESVPPVEHDAPASPGKVAADVDQGKDANQTTSDGEASSDDDATGGEFTAGEVAPQGTTPCPAKADCPVASGADICLAKGECPNRNADGTPAALSPAGLPPSQPSPSPTSGSTPVVEAPQNAESESNDDTRWRAAETGTAAVALLGLSSLAFVWWRRRA